MNAFAYLVRRETWEHKSLCRGPVIAAVVLIVLVLLLLFKFAAGSGLSMNMDMPHYLIVGSTFMFVVLYGIIFMVGVFVAIFYLLDSLYAERKNRSILFWKSLPISDTETVLAKLIAATVLVPVVALISVVACWLIMQLIAAVTIGLLGGNGWPVLWQPVVLFNGIAIAIKSSAGLLLWYMPIAGWLLLVSVWARRLVFLWAVLPPVAIVFFERWLFDSEHFVNLLGHRLVGFQTMLDDSEIRGIFHGGMDGVNGVTASEAMNQMISFTKLLSEPGLYGGILVAAAFVTGAIFLRRYRDET